MSTATTILIVDDEPRNRLLLTTLLNAEGYTVLSSANGTEALTILETQLPALILLDLMMPDMDGFDVVRRLKANPNTSRIPIIMATAVDDPGSKARLQSAGVADFLIKPIDRWLLKQLVGKALGHESGTP